jgi:NitT/TauT family transport system ATP-binding protein/nitrate/nitrite transport system substrate-binding protein
MKVRLGYAPLSDSAPLVAAQALGFFADEGLQAELSREVSWATIRDKLALGALDGAHLLAPMALAAAVGEAAPPVVVPMALAHGGAGITLSERIVEAAGEEASGLARLIARRRAERASPLTLAVVYPYSTHNYLLRTWLAEAGLDPAADLHMTVAAPSRMAELLGGGVIEGFCAGEPWGPAAQAAGAGRVVARVGDLWPVAPDKVLGFGRAWAEADRPRLEAVLRALGRAAGWCAEPKNREALAGLLAERLELGAEVILPGLAHLAFEAQAANRAEAAWLLEQMRRWGQLDAAADRRALAEAVYRPDLCA